MKPNMSNTAALEEEVRRLRQKVKKYKGKRDKYKRRAHDILEKSKSGVLCTICVDIFANPFTLECGHSFCYACISGWFDTSCGDGDDYISPTCPTCRRIVSRSPIRNNGLGAMAGDLAESLGCVNILSKRMVEGTNMLERDGHGGKVDPFSQYVRPTQLIDFEDGMSRCPHCLWEVVDGTCSNCATVFARNPIVESEGDVCDDSDIDDSSYLATDQSELEYEEEDRACQFMDLECDIEEVKAFMRPGKRRRSLIVDELEDCD
eukprot:Partr_v1_DN28352_c3_g1_i5_m79302 putative RING finger